MIDASIITKPNFCLRRYVAKLAFPRVVAVTGADRDWVAYAGPDTMGWDEIESNGDKLARDVAEKIFPEFVGVLRWRN